MSVLRENPIEDLLDCLVGPSEEVFEACPGEFLSAQAKTGCEGLESLRLVFFEGNGDFSHMSTLAYCTSAFTNRQDEQAAERPRDEPPGQPKASIAPKPNAGLAGSAPSSC